MKLTAKDFRWINRAIGEATRSKHRVRVGAAVVSKQRGSVGHNTIRNPASIAWENASTHAEINALRCAVNGGVGAVVYVARIGKRGDLLPSYPCERCLPDLVDARVKRIVWFDGEKWIKERVPAV